MEVSLLIEDNILICFGIYRKIFYSLRTRLSVITTNYINIDIKPTTYYRLLDNFQYLSKYLNTDCIEI